MKSSLAFYLLVASILAFLNATKAQGEIGECSNWRPCPSEDQCCLIKESWVEKERRSWKGGEGNWKNQEGNQDNQEGNPDDQEENQDNREGNPDDQEENQDKRERNPDDQGRNPGGRDRNRKGRKIHPFHPKERNGTCVSGTGEAESQCSVFPHHGHPPRHRHGPPHGRRQKRQFPPPPPPPPPREDGQDGPFPPPPPPREDGQDGPFPSPPPPPREDGQDGPPTQQPEKYGQISNGTRGQRHPHLFHHHPHNLFGICGCKLELNLHCSDEGICVENEDFSNQTALY